MYLKSPACRVLILILVAQFIPLSAHGAPPQEPGRAVPVRPAKPDWTMEQALEQLRLYPRDTYLQYALLRLAEREGRVDEARRQIESGTRNRNWRRGRTEQVDLVRMFSGSLAVQESLQLDTLAGRNRDGSTRVEPPASEQAATVPITSLDGPKVKSHPWEEMLAGRKPDVARLARSVPCDFYYIEFHSVNKLLTLLKQGDPWGSHLFSQTVQKAYRHGVRERVMGQLAVETSELLQPFYDLAVSDLAVAGSDLFATSGSDITLLFQIRQPAIFRAQMEAMLSNAMKSVPGSRRSEGTYRSPKRRSTEPLNPNTANTGGPFSIRL